MSKYAKIVGAILVCHMDRAYENGFPGVQRLMTLSGLTRQKVWDATRELVEHPEAFMVRDGGGGAVYVYRLTRTDFLADQIGEAVANLRATGAENRPGPEETGAEMQPGTGAENRPGTPRTGAKRRPGTGAENRPGVIVTGAEMQPGQAPTGAEMQPGTGAENRPSVIVTGAENRPLSVGNQPCKVSTQGADLFGEPPPVEVNGTAVYVRFAPDDEVTIPKNLIVKTGRALGLPAAEAIDVAVIAFEGWLADGFRPKQPAAVLPGSMKRAAERMAKAGHGAADVARAQTTPPVDPFDSSKWQR